MKCDLHVHSIHSGMFGSPLLKHFCRECYSHPEEVYATLKRRGMELVTLTDHDSIDGAEALRHHADFLLSEEVTCRMPSGTEVHVGVYDITERQHIEIQRRRDNLIALLIYLTERRLFFSINHVFSSLTGPRAREDFAWFETYFPAYETRNGQMLPEQNRQAELLAARTQKLGVAGSDAHTLPALGTTFTSVPGARCKEEFFDGLRRGRGRACGESGSYAKLTRDVFLIAAEMMQERPWTALLAPLATLIPAVTLGHLRRESVFVRSWSSRLSSKPTARIPLALWQPRQATGEVVA